MIEVEGYRAFKGIMLVTPHNTDFKPFQVEGSFLYKPDTECWYSGGQSFMDRVCVVVKDYEYDDKA